MSNGRKYFRKEAVLVLHPSLGRPYDVVRPAMPDMASMPTVKGGFNPFRLVINLKVIDPAHPDKKTNTFTPPLEVRVRYTDADEQEAKRRGMPLRLGYWDGAKWQYFTLEGHAFKLKRKRYKQYVGWGIVKLSEWGDPPKAWGT
jgi:hypothetical protein